MKFSTSISAALVGLAMAVTWISASNAQDKKLLIELNRIDQQAEACRFDWRITNQTTSRINDFTAEIVLFDKAGVNIARMAVPFGKLLAEKSMLLSYQLEPFDCTSVGEVLFNDIAVCAAEPALDCVAAVSVSSRAPIPFNR